MSIFSEIFEWAWNLWPLSILFLVVLYYVLRYLWELVPVSSNFSDKAIFITGADSGFGYMTTVKCAQNGMTVFAGCFTQEGRKKMLEENEQTKGSIIPVELDVTNEEIVKKAAEFVKENLKPDQQFWALLNNAGMFTWYGPNEWCQVEEYEKMLNVNFFGMVRCTHAFLPLLKKSRGRIVSMSSICGRVSYEGVAAYSVSKFAIEAWMDAMRQELKVYGITCCILEPSGFRTGFVDYEKFALQLEKIWNRLPTEIREEYGIEYKQKFMDDFRGIKDALSTNFGHVINNYYHAITARWPRLRYQCGWESIFVYIPMSYLPTYLLDIVCRRVLAFNRVPASLKVSVLTVTIAKHQRITSAKAHMSHMYSFEAD